MRNYDEDDVFATVWCLECGKECYVKRVDYGMGRLECWGVVETHHDYRHVSSCCEADFTDEEPNE